MAAAKRERRAVQTYRALCLGGAKGTRPPLRTRPGRGSGSPLGCHSLPRPFESPVAAAKREKRAVQTYRALCLGGAKGTRPRLRTRPGRGSGSPPGCHSLPRPFESPLAAAKREKRAVQTYRALCLGGAKGTRPRLRTRPGRGSGSPPGCHSLPRPFESPLAAAKKEKHAVQTYRALCLGGAKGTRPPLRTRPGRGSGSPPGCHSLPRPFESPVAAAKKEKRAVSTNRALCLGGAKGTRPRLRTRPGRGSGSPPGCHSLPRPFESPLAAAKRERRAVQTNRALLVGGAKGTRTPDLNTASVAY